MDNDEAVLNNSVLVVLENVAAITRIVAKLIETDALKHMDRQKLAQDMLQVSEKVIAIRDGLEEFKKRQNAQHLKTPWGEQGPGPVSNN